MKSLGVKSIARIAVVLAVVATLSSAVTRSPACTGITIKPKDGSVIFARTLEFASDLESAILIVPRGHEFTGTAPGDKPGLQWKNSYGFVGANAFGLPMMLDGLNEKGLAVGLFYFPGTPVYQEVMPNEYDNTLGPWELGCYLLGTCANVDEAVSAAKKVRVGNAVLKAMDMVPPVHFIVTDSTGKSVVLEHIDGQLKVHLNPLGVMSNSPAFDWHMTNLSNYVMLSDMNIPKRDLAGRVVESLGQGSGMLGLPGDFTPPSRFVRAVAFTQSALPVERAEQGVLQAFHLLNQFDIPKGSARGEENGQVVADYTQWTAASDLKNLRYHFRTFDNSRIRMVDLKAADFDAPAIRTISMQGDEQIEDVTATAK